jgi:hypothetical protein
MGFGWWGRPGSNRRPLPCKGSTGQSVYLALCRKRYARLVLLGVSRLFCFVPFWSETRTKRGLNEMRRTHSTTISGTRCVSLARPGRKGRWQLLLFRCLPAERHREPLRGGPVAPPLASILRSHRSLALVRPTHRTQTPCRLGRQRQTRLPHWNSLSCPPNHNGSLTYEIHSGAERPPR